MHVPSALLLIFSLARLVHASVTVYGQIPFGQTTRVSAAPGSATTTLAAYDDTTLDPPPIPNPAPARDIGLQLQKVAGDVQGLSIPHAGGGAFWGFSIEMSVISQVRE